MGTNSKWINGNLVYHDSKYKYRFYDAFGPTVCKYVDDFVRMPVDDTTGDPTEWNLTIVEVGAGDTVTSLESGVAGGVLLITNAGNDNDGLQAQLKGEAFKLASGKPLYFGVKLKISSATQSDLMVGLCINEGASPDILGAVTDGVYFRKIDGTTTCNFVLEKDSAETATAAWTAATTAYVTLEFYFDGTYIDFWVDGVKGTRPVTTNLPDDEELTVSLAWLNGEAAVGTCRIDWIRCIQFN